jgi:acetyl esterase
VRTGNALCTGGPNVAVSDFEINGPGGRLAMREYLPRDLQAGRVLVYLHGGGWVTGDLDYSDQICRHLSHACGAVVLSVDYRLAPEHPFPAAVDDAWAGLAYADRAYPHRGGLCVAGDSAGGALAAAIAVRARDEGTIRIDGQLLIYPVTDADFARPSYLECADAFPMGSAAMSWFWDHYVPDPVLRKDPMASPLHSPRVADLPSTAIVVAGHDPLRGEGQAYGERLREEGVPVTMLEYLTLGHGFLRMTAVCTAARAAIDDITECASALYPRPADDRNHA